MVLFASILGLAPQAVCFRPLRGLERFSFCFYPGACAPAFMLPPATRARTLFPFASILGLAPQALCFRPLRGLGRFFLLRLSWGLRPRLYASARYAGSNAFSFCVYPGACAPGFMLPPA